MSFVTGFRGVFLKEFAELFREKRLFAVVLAIVGLLAIPLSLFLDDLLGSGYGIGFSEPLMPVAYVGPLALMILAVTFAADSVSKERDSGMLGLLLVSPVAPAGVLLAKVAAAFVAYFILAGVLTLTYATFAHAVGWVLLEVLFWIFMVPFFALFTFLVGASLFVSVLTKTSRSAVALASGVNVLLFFFTQEEPGIGFLLRQVAPRIYEWLEFNPMGAGSLGARALLSGSPFAWLPIITTFLAGVALVGAAYLVFRRQEVAA